MCDAPTETASKFREYFSNIGPQLVEKIPHSQDSYLRFLPPKNVNSLFLIPHLARKLFVYAILFGPEFQLVMTIFQYIRDGLMVGGED